MSDIKSPFTKAQLIPQEETLELTKEKGELFIGIPKESYFQEKRICLTPDAVAAIVANDHRVLIENGAGEKAGFTDIEYTKAGAELISCEPGSLASIIESLNAHGDLASVLPQCSYLVDGLAPSDVNQNISAGSTIDVLPRFAGGA